MKRNRKGKKTIEIKWGKMEKRRWAGRVEKRKRRLVQRHSCLRNFMLTTENL